MTESQHTSTTEAPASASSPQWTDVRFELIALAIVALGFVLRVRDAWGTFLTPDEALHFFIANRASLDAVYGASLTQAHPPLLFFLLYGLRSFGNSEFILRLPSILTGTLFCWIFFRWLTRILGPTVGIVGLVFAALLPPMVSLTAQVRQYGLLLVFLISGAWFLERALAENSPKLMVLSATCLWLAMLSHYSALLFIAVIGMWALLLMWRERTSVGTVLAWVAGQAVALALAIFLYLTHISKIRGTTMAEQAFDGWLRKSYFHRSDNPLTFLVTRSFSFFQYIFGQLVIGDIVALLFVVGIILLLFNKAQMLRRGAERYQLAVLLVVPFLLNYAGALFDLYPYGGTRHCVFLAIFALTAVSICVVSIARQSALRGIAISVALVALCWLFRTNHAPYIARADQSRAHMQDAVRFVRERIPASDPILADYESGMELGHYLCAQKQISYDAAIPGFLVFHCAGHRVISTVPDVWAFTPPVFLRQWANLVGSGYVKSGDAVWVVQAGWMVKLDEDLKQNFPEFHDLNTQAFGNNIRFFELSVGQPMPMIPASPEGATPEQH
jgi:Dolichyl-phosphate-mannose-protein mannosyltransferase